MISQNILVTNANDDETDREEYILGGNAYDGNNDKNCRKTGRLRVKAVSELNRSNNNTDELVSNDEQISSTANSCLKRKVLVWTVKKVPVMLNKSTIVKESETSSCSRSKRIKLTDAIHLNDLDEVDTEEITPEVVSITTAQCKDEPVEILSDEYDADYNKEDDNESNSVYVSRGKYRNSTQVQIFLEFMEAHPDLANNSIHMDRVAADVLWTDLMRKLNMNGPPRRDVIQWKKVWFDWKCIVRRKLSQNMNEIEITHGKQVHKYMLNDKEKTIARICHLFDLVNDVSGPHKVENKSDKTRTESTSSKGIPKLSTAHFEFPTKVINCRNPLQSVQKRLTCELRAVQSIASSMEHTLQNLKKNAKIRAKRNDEFQKAYESLEKLTELISKKNTLICEQNEERRNQYFEIEKTAAEKTKLKWKKLQVERLKLKKGILKGKNS